MTAPTLPAVRSAGGKEVRASLGEEGARTTPHRLGRIYARLVYSPTGCLLWTGALDRGYGKVNSYGRNYRVHRLLYEALVGPVSPDLDLDHLCRVRSCANPLHLEPVTRRENLRRGAGMGGNLRRVGA